jgi:hypothetical protein
LRGGDRELERKAGKKENANFLEIVKKAYDNGTNEHEMTLEKLMADLKADLKSLMVG